MNKDNKDFTVSNNSENIFTAVICTNDKPVYTDEVLNKIAKDSVGLVVKSAIMSGIISECKEIGIILNAWTETVPDMTTSDNRPFKRVVAEVMYAYDCDEKFIDSIKSCTMKESDASFSINNIHNINDYKKYIELATHLLH